VAERKERQMTNPWFTDPPQDPPQPDTDQKAGREEKPKPKKRS
jgi:hypothetical protein